MGRVRVRVIPGPWGRRPWRAGGRRRPRRRRFGVSGPANDDSKCRTTAPAAVQPPGDDPGRYRIARAWTWHAVGSMVVDTERRARLAVGRRRRVVLVRPGKVLGGRKRLPVRVEGKHVIRRRAGRAKSGRVGRGAAAAVRVRRRGLLLGKRGEDGAVHGVKALRRAPQEDAGCRCAGPGARRDTPAPHTGREPSRPLWRRAVHLPPLAVAHMPQTGGDVDSTKVVLCSHTHSAEAPQRAVWVTPRRSPPKPRAAALLPAGPGQGRDGGPAAGAPGLRALGPSL